MVKAYDFTGMSEKQIEEILKHEASQKVSYKDANGNPVKVEHNPTPRSKVPVPHPTLGYTYVDPADPEIIAILERTHGGKFEDEATFQRVLHDVSCEKGWLVVKPEGKPDMAPLRRKRGRPKGSKDRNPRKRKIKVPK
jgi:hypothetical protein